MSQLKVSRDGKGNMIIGFTGTQRGMNEAQKIIVHDLLEINGVTVFHHGDCIGADADSHDIARKFACRIVIHPPKNSIKRAFKVADELRLCRPYLERNACIVNECSLLLATPGEQDEQLRSGTWATIRFARKMRTDHIIIYPNAKFEFTRY